MIRLADVDLNHALGEGEGYTSVAEFTVDDDTLVVAQEFRLIDD